MRSPRVHTMTQADPIEAAENHCSGSCRSPSMLRQAIGFFAASWAAGCCLSGTHAQARTLGDVPEAIAACRPLQDLVFGNAVVVGDSRVSQTNLAWVGFPFPSGSMLVACEVNTNFVYAS